LRHFLSRWRRDEKRRKARREARRQEGREEESQRGLEVQNIPVGTSSTMEASVTTDVASAERSG
jgi:hypothetical protein